MRYVDDNINDCWLSFVQWLLWLGLNILSYNFCFLPLSFSASILLSYFFFLLTPSMGGAVSSITFLYPLLVEKRGMLYLFQCYRLKELEHSPYTFFNFTLLIGIGKMYIKIRRCNWLIFISSNGYLIVKTQLKHFHMLPVSFCTISNCFHLQPLTQLQSLWTPVNLWILCTHILLYIHTYIHTRIHWNVNVVCGRVYVCVYIYVCVSATNLINPKGKYVYTNKENL